MFSASVRIWKTGDHQDGCSIIAQQHDTNCAPCDRQLIADGHEIMTLNGETIDLAGGPDDIAVSGRPDTKQSHTHINSKIALKFK